MKLHIENIQHHRNGICGAPFHVLIFGDPDEGRMLGIVFGQQHHVAVFNLDKLADGNIAFGVNSWRGDRYEPHLRKAIGVTLRHVLDEDARLREAAPELLEALKLIAQGYDGGGKLSREGMQWIAQTAIANMTGRAA